MNLTASIALAFGGPGSGCNPSAGTCGRPSTGGDAGGQINQSGWVHEGKFYPLNSGEVHPDAAIRLGFAKPGPSSSYATLLQKGNIRIMRTTHDYSVQAWDKNTEGLRDAISRLPDKADVFLETAVPRKSENVSKEEALDMLGMAAGGDGSGCNPGAGKCGRPSGRQQLARIDSELREGAANGTRVTLDYRPGDDDTTHTYDVEPYSYRNGGKTFFGYDVVGKSIKAFTMMNIVRVQQTGKKYTPRWPVELAKKAA